MLYFMCIRNLSTIFPAIGNKPKSNKDPRIAFLLEAHVFVDCSTRLDHLHRLRRRRCHR
jgi:hypothetical protein